MNNDIVLLDDEALDSIHGGNGGGGGLSLLGLNLGAQLGVSADVSLGECKLLSADLCLGLGLNLSL